MRASISKCYFVTYHMASSKASNVYAHPCSLFRAFAHVQCMPKNWLKFTHMHFSRGNISVVVVGILKTML